MSELQEIDVTITQEGRLSVEIRGVKGPKCLELTKALEEALGGEILERRKTYEFDQQPAADRERDRLHRGDQ